jgi:adenosylmethionine-8-amino-7-oxononanoate aminotransferase
MKLADHHLFVRDLRCDYPVIVKGKGPWIWNQEGKRYFDGCSGANVTGIGHGVTEVAEAMAEQAAQIAYVPPQHFLNRASIDFAEKLLSLAPQGYSRVMLCSGGSEAIENALKIARQFFVYRGSRSKYRVISRWQGFHGNTLGADAVSGKTSRRTIQTPMLMPVPHIVQAECYRCAFNAVHPACGVMCARDLERTLRQEGSEYVCAFIAEPIVGAASGATTPVAEYYGLIREICDRHDVLFIADEVMTGAGRTGTFLAIEQWAVTPDLVVLAKGLSSGYAPLAAILVHERVFRAFADSKSPFVGGHTYNCHPVTSAAGLAVLRYLEDHGIIREVPRKGELLAERLKLIAERVPLVGDVRGRGLMWGLELVKDRVTKLPFPVEEEVNMRVIRRAQQNGLIVYPVSGCADGVQGDGVLICPPLISTDEEIDFLAAALEKSLAEIGEQLGVTG